MKSKLPTSPLPMSLKQSYGISPPPHLHLNDKKLEVPTFRDMHHHDGIHGRNNVTPDHKWGNDTLLFYSKYYITTSTISTTIYLWVQLGAWFTKPQSSRQRLPAGTTQKTCSLLHVHVLCSWLALTSLCVRSLPHSAANASSQRHSLRDLQRALLLSHH